MDLVAVAYPWLKATHLVALIVWIGGQIATAALVIVAARGDAARLAAGGAIATVLARSLLNPALGAVFITGIALIVLLGMPWFAASHWLHAKLPLVLVLAGSHGALIAAARRAADGDARGATRARIVAWATTATAALVVGLAVVKPF